MLCILDESNYTRTHYIMNTKSEYPVTDSITNVVEASIVVAATMSLIACEVTRCVGHKMEGGVYKGIKSSWGLVKGARQRLVTYRERISKKVAEAKSKAVADTPVQPPVEVPVETQARDEAAPTPAGMPTPAFA